MILQLKKGKESNLQRLHPWIFSGALRNVPRHIKAGTHVQVADSQDTVLATGHYHPGSIAVRVLAFEDCAIDSDFWIGKLEKAVTYRRSLGLGSDSHTDCYRLIHGEGDGLPGLIIDIYGSMAVVQCHSVGIYEDREDIALAVKQVLAGSVKDVYYSAKHTLPGQYGDDVEDTYHNDSHAPSMGIVRENDVQFEVNWETGQKTGFFLDQRINRHILQSYARGKTVLNCFCYTGGFSMYALQGGASKVTSMDISQTATDLVRKNHDLNGYDDSIHDIQTVNVMKALQADELQNYDIVVIDPPAFAKSIKKRHNAVQAYKRLNAMALRKVTSGGYLFTFSCSQVVDTPLFTNTVRAAAIETGRNIRIVQRLSQGPDHPVNIYHPEGSYLKGLILYVE